MASLGLALQIELAMGENTRCSGTNGASTQWFLAFDLTAELFLGEAGADS